VARALAAVEPDVREIARANRAFLGRAVRFLSAAGVRQFLDIGSGIPTDGNVHEVAQRADPEARVVYADIDQVAIAHSEAILAGSENATVIDADLREPDATQAHARPRAEILRFFDGFELVDPGLVRIPLWRPDSPADVPDDPGKFWGLVGVGRKPPG
jgi:hypothetical protein